MVSPSLSIPSQLLGEFRQFQRDFERVTGQWLVRGEETDDSIQAARAGLRRYMADTSDPDAAGVGRVVRLQQVFDGWREMAERLTPNGVAVVPEPRMTAASEAGKRQQRGEK